MANKKLEHYQLLLPAYASRYYGWLPCQWCSRKAVYSAFGYAWCSVHLPGPEGIQATPTTVAPEDQDKTQQDPLFDPKVAFAKAEALNSMFGFSATNVLQGVYVKAGANTTPELGPLEDVGEAPEPPKRDPVPVLELDGDGTPGDMRAVVIEDVKKRMSTLDLDGGTDSGNTDGIDSYSAVIRGRNLELD